MDRARILIEVVAGIIPEQKLPELTKQFAITSDAWYKQGKYEGKAEEAELEVMKTFGLAQEYMRTLWNPQRVNWVRCDWIYL
jgi:hypothetical protein